MSTWKNIYCLPKTGGASIREGDSIRITMIGNLYDTTLWVHHEAFTDIITGCTKAKNIVIGQ